ncbi:MAG: glycine cleavage T C-terminal barrel domain-containing protein, partial [Pseudomonadota bacterium]
PRATRTVAAHEPRPPRAVEAMRLEKGFLHWKGDILTEFDPFETGLDRFVRFDKPDFVGKAALQARMAARPQKKLVTLAVDCTDRPAHPGSSLMEDGRFVGTVTSGAWGHRVGMNLAYAFVEPGLADPGTAVTLDLLGDMIPAKVIAPCPYDPGFDRLRA